MASVPGSIPRKPVPDLHRLMAQLHALIDSGNTVVVIEHDVRVIAGGDWVIDVGPGAGRQGGQIVAVGTPTEFAAAPASLTAKYLRRYLVSYDERALGLPLSQFAGAETLPSAEPAVTRSAF